MTKKKCTQCGGKMEGHDGCSGCSVCGACYRANVREEQKKKLAAERCRSIDPADERRKKPLDEWLS